MTKEKVFDFLRKEPDSNSVFISDMLKISKKEVEKYLKELYEEGLVLKYTDTKWFVIPEASPRLKKAIKEGLVVGGKK